MPERYLTGKRRYHGPLPGPYRYDSTPKPAGFSIVPDQNIIIIRDLSQYVTVRATDAKEQREKLLPWMKSLIIGVYAQDVFMHANGNGRWLNHPAVKEAQQHAGEDNYPKPSNNEYIPGIVAFDEILHSMDKIFNPKRPEGKSFTASYKATFDAQRATAVNDLNVHALEIFGLYGQKGQTIEVSPARMNRLVKILQANNHDTRTAITALMGYHELLPMLDDFTQSISRFADKITKSFDDIRDILDSTILEIGGIFPKETWSFPQLDGTIEETLREKGHYSLKRNPVPKNLEGLTFVGAQIYLKRLFENMATNISNAHDAVSYPNQPARPYADATVSYASGSEYSPTTQETREYDDVIFTDHGTGFHEKLRIPGTDNLYTFRTNVSAWSEVLPAGAYAGGEGIGMANLQEIFEEVYGIKFILKNIYDDKTVTGAEFTMRIPRGSIQK